MLVSTRMQVKELCQKSSQVRVEKFVYLVKWIGMESLNGFMCV